MEERPAAPMMGKKRRLGVCSWSLRPASIDDLITKVKATGLSAIQLALEPIRAGHSGFEDADRCFAALQTAGITVLSGMLEPVGEDYSTLEAIKRTGGLRPTEHLAANLTRARQCAKLCEQYGISLVTMHAGFLPENPSDKLHDLMVDRIVKLTEVFASQDIILGLETGQERAETLLDLLDHIDEPTLGVNFDPANMILYNMGDPTAALEALVDYVVQLHIKDANVTPKPGTWGSEVPAGTGQVDWNRFFAFAQKELPGLDMLIEREAGEQREADVRLAAQLVRRSVSDLA